MFYFKREKERERERERQRGRERGREKNIFKDQLTFGKLCYCFYLFLMISSIDRQ